MSNICVFISDGTDSVVEIVSSSSAYVQTDYLGHIYIKNPEEVPFCGRDQT
jgi:hypothetical protein